MFGVKYASLLHSAPVTVPIIGPVFYSLTVALDKCSPLVLFLGPCNMCWSLSARKYSRFDVPIFLSNICRPRLFIDECLVCAKYKSCKDRIIIIIIKVSCPGHEGMPDSSVVILQIKQFVIWAINRSGAVHGPAALPTGVNRYPLKRRLGEPQSRYGGFWRTTIILPFGNRTPDLTVSPYLSR